MKKILLITLSMLVIGFLAYLMLSKDDFSIMNQQTNQASGNIIINLDKESYLPGEQVVIQLTTGNCDSELELYVNDEAVEIEKTANCQAVSLQPQFVGVVNPREEKEYLVKVLDKNRNMSTEKNFIVSSEVPEFSITRWGSKTVKISQSDRYIMKLIIETNKDFTGVVQDIIPPFVEVVWYGNANIVTNNDNKTLTWDIETTANTPLELSYEYTITNPQNFTIGPAYLIKNGKTIYKENNQWQILSINE